MLYCKAHLTLNSVISSLCYLVLSHRVFSIYYPKSIQGGGGILAFGALISFPTPSCTESLPLKINPASSGGLQVFACWWKNVVQLGLRSVQFLALEILLVAQPSAPLQHCCSPLPLLQMVAQGGYDKMPSTGRVRVKPGMSVAASALREQGLQPPSSDMRPLGLSYRCHVSFTKSVRTLDINYTTLLMSSLPYQEAAFTTAPLRLLSSTQMQLMSHLCWVQMWGGYSA